MSDQVGWDDMPDEPFYQAATRKHLQDLMARRNKWRWRRLNRDYKWLEKEMKKLGLNPEDARFLL